MAITTPIDLDSEQPEPHRDRSLRTDRPARPAASPSSSDVGGPYDGMVASPASRYLLAALSLGAAAIHFAMVPSHAGSSMVEGIGFALSGWFQVIFAGALLARPHRRWLQLGIAANLLFVAVWAVSRTRGLPIGAHAGVVEAASSIDMLCVGLEVAVALFAAMSIVYPRFLADLPKAALTLGSIVPVAALVAATAAIASPAASTHGGAGHGHGEEAAAGATGAAHDHGATAAGAATGASGDGHAHDATATATAGDAGHDAGHDHAATPVVAAEDRCDWGFNTQTYWAKNPPAKEDPAHMGSHSEHEEAAASAGNGQGNEHGAQAWNPITDQATCDELKAQTDKMQEVALRYPTAQDALDAGCIRVTIFVPGIAAHYACFGNGWDAKADLEKPEMLLYGGSQPWAPIVGLSYMVYTPENPSLDPDQSLWVRYMPFHYHQGLCIKDALVIGGDNSSKEECEARGGKVQGKTGFMGHYWMPECNSPDGVFSADNPRLDLGVANVNDMPENDPKAGGDPSVLAQSPCAGSSMGDGLSDTFGAPA